MNRSVMKMDLISHLRELESINTQLVLETDNKKRANLLSKQKSNAKSIKKITEYLNSIGKISDKEARSLMALDLFNMKKLNIGFKIGRD